MCELPKIDTEILAFAEDTGDAEQIAAYLAQQHFAPGQVMIVALSIEAERWLAATTWQAFPLREFTVLEDALPDLYAKAVEMGDTWYLGLELEDDFFEQATTPHYRDFFFHALVCEHVLSEVFRGVSPGRVLLLPIGSLPIDAHLELHMAFPGYRSVFSVLLRGYCRQQDVPTMETAPLSLLQRMALHVRPWQRIAARLWCEVPSPCQSLDTSAQTIRAAFHRLIHQTEPGGLRVVKDDRYDVLITNWGADMERNLRISDVVVNPAFSDLRMLHLVRGKDPLPTLRAQPNHRIERSRKTSVPPTGFVVDFLWGVFVKRWWRFQRLRRSLATEHGAWFAERQLDYMFIFMFFDAYLEAFLSRLRVREWVAKYQMKALVGSDVDAVTFRAYLLAAKESGVTTLTTNHGFYLFEPPRSNFLADYCLVGGPALRRNLIQGGVPPEQVHVIGNSSFDPLPAIKARQVEERPIILIITSYAPKLISYQDRRAEYFQTLEGVCDLTTANDAWQVVIKSHPFREHYELYDDIVARLQRPNLSHVSVSWKRDEFQKAAVAIAFAESGSLLELQSFGVPIVFVDGFILSYLRPYVEGCGVPVSTPREAAEVVSRLVTDNVFRQEVVDSGYRFLQSYTDMPNNNIERFAQVLNCAVKNAWRL